MQILKVAQEQGILDKEAHHMIGGVLEVAENYVSDVMIPRPHMVVLEKDSTPEALLKVIIESGHSRFPVIGDNRDEINGILLAKDLLRVYANGDVKDFDIKECLRPAVFVPESKRLNVLLQEFRETQNHMAIVVDEYGAVAGLATIEDVIEQIVGDIDDEHDIEEEVAIQKEDDALYTVQAVTRIDEFNEYFGSQFPDEEFDTVGGLIMHQLGRLPRRGESMDLSGIRFRILRSDRRRIESVQVRLLDGKELPASANVA